MKDETHSDESTSRSFCTCAAIKQGLSHIASTWPTATVIGVLSRMHQTWHRNAIATSIKTLFQCTSDKMAQHAACVISVSSTHIKSDHLAEYLTALEHLSNGHAC